MPYIKYFESSNQRRTVYGKFYKIMNLRMQFKASQETTFPHSLSRQNYFLLYEIRSRNFKSAVFPSVDDSSGL